MVLGNPRWAHYLRVQIKLSSTTVLDDSSWGLEAELNRALASGGEEPLEALERAAQSGSRRERYRRALLRHHFSAETADAEVAAQARQQLQQVKARMSDDEWQLASRVAVGSSYAEIANDTGESASTLRVRMQRARNKAGPLAA